MRSRRRTSTRAEGPETALHPEVEGGAQLAKMDAAAAAEKERFAKANNMVVA